MFIVSVHCCRPAVLNSESSSAFAENKSPFLRVPACDHFGFSYSQIESDGNIAGCCGGAVVPFLPPTRFAFSFMPLAYNLGGITV
jgi:hypothetical protein